MLDMLWKCDGFQKDDQAVLVTVRNDWIRSETVVVVVAEIPIYCPRI